MPDLDRHVERLDRRAGDHMNDVKELSELDEVSKIGKRPWAAALVKIGAVGWTEDGCKRQRIIADTDRAIRVTRCEYDALRHCRQRMVHNFSADPHA